MLLGSPKSIAAAEQYSVRVMINSVDIERVKEARNLGVILDEHLRFERHINNIISKCFYRLKMLYRIRRYLTTELRVTLCEALVLSKLNYSDSLYGPRLLYKTKCSIQRVQNACARYCWNIPPREHVSPYLREAKILNMEARRRLHLGILLFGIVNFKTPQYLYTKLEWLGQHNLNIKTRSALQVMSVPRHHTTAFRGGFRYNATKCWNDIPPPLKQIKSISNFRLKYKKHIFETLHY
ncbi:unnamed protein product [Colias eurytheme]|nr:unnamed protein product [Colias eurytheme]